MRNMMKEWINGHITITIRGRRFERLINMAVRDGLHLWNIRKHGSDLGQCEILVSDYFRLRPLLRETGCRVHVEKRDGLPFWLIRMRLRAGFTLGVLLFLIGLYMLSSFVWSVEVMGTHQISEAEVTKAAEKIGIKPGAWKVKLKEPQIMQRQLLGLLPKASWVGVQIQGTKAIIQVVEKNEPAPKPQLSPRHLIARKKAVIHSILAEAGKPMVSVNQFVDKGQVLISGIIGNDQRQSLVAARGKVQGEVWYLSNVAVSTTQARYNMTGARLKVHYLLAGPYAIRVWPFRFEPFASAEKSEERYLLDVAGFRFPVGWKVETLSETRPQTRTLTREEAVEIGKRFARHDVLKRAGGDASVKEEKVLHVKEENGKVYLSIHYAVIEDIAEERPLVALPPAPPQDADTPN